MRVIFLSRLCIQRCLWRLLYLTLFVCLIAWYSWLKYDKYLVVFYLRPRDFSADKHFALVGTDHGKLEAFFKSEQQPQPIADIYGSDDWAKICKHEWEQVSTFTFFRRDASFYLIDLKMIKLFMVTHRSNYRDYLFTVTVYVEGRGATESRIQSDSVWILEEYDVGDYGLYKVDIPFNILQNPLVRDQNNLDELIRANRLAIKVHVHEQEFNKSSERSLIVIPKYVHRKSLKKHSAMICSKCYWLNKAEVKQMDWWIRFNKRIGFEKIVVCNNTIEYSPESADGFEALFDRYSDYIQVNQMNCLPHFLTWDRFQKNGTHYIRSFKQLTMYTGEFNLWLTDIFDKIMFNVCYLNNAQDYRHIAVIDFDETFLPPLIEEQFFTHDNFDYVRKLSLSDQKDARNAIDSLKCSAYSAPESDPSMAGVEWAYKSKLERFANDIAANDPRYKKPASLYFETGWILKNRILSKIFAKFEDYFFGANFNRSLSYHLITVIDRDPQSAQHLGVNLTFNITNSEEISYAKNLVKLYYLYVQPYLESIDSKLASVSNQYNRFFALASIKHNQFVWGKSIHNTLSSSQVCHHYPCGSRRIEVNFDHGHLSHFRKGYLISSQEILNVRQLIFDYNYLNCYFKPILNELTNETE